MSSNFLVLAKQISINVAAGNMSVSDAKKMLQANADRTVNEIVESKLATIKQACKRKNFLLEENEEIDPDY